MILDTSVNKLVHDVAELNSKKGIESEFEQRSQEFLKFTRYACAKILHKTENKFRNKNKRFLFVNLNRNSSEDIKKYTQSWKFEKYCRIEVSFQKQWGYFDSFETIHSHTESRNL